MDVSRPHATALRASDADVLRVLAGTKEPMTGRRIYRLSGASALRTVQLALDRLAADGLLDTTEQGSARLYSLNRDHLAASAVLELVSLRRRLIDRLREQLAAFKPRPRFAALFGSTARGDGNAASDIDLFVVRPDTVAEDDPRWLGQIESLEQAVRRWTGNRLSVSEIAEDELRQAIAEERPIIVELREDAVPLIGRSINSYFRSL